MDSAITLIKKELHLLDKGDAQFQQIKRKGNSLYINGQILLLSLSRSRYEFAADDEFEDYQVTVMANESVGWSCSCKAKGPSLHLVAE